MIKINFEAAEKIATRMGQASDSIQRATNKTISKAEKTTLTVNEQAQIAHEKAQHLTILYNEAFQKTIQNIQKVAKEFERTDQELQNIFNIQDMNRDAHTYRRAKRG